jgi:hypothetical protein
VARQKNQRFINGGLLLLAAAGLFFLYMLGFAPKSNDAAGMMAIVGQTSGIVAGIGGVLIVLGLMGKGFPQR